MADYQSTIELRAVTRDLDRKLAGVKKSLQGINTQVTKTQAGFKNMSAKAVGSLKRLDAKVKSSKLAIAGFAASFALVAGQGVKAFKTWEDGLTQIQTLGVKNIGSVAKQLKLLRREYGVTGAEATKGYYDIISAGAKAGAQATERLTAAIELAKAGNTGLALSVDIVTSGLNVWAKSGITAREVTDKLFLAVKYGKTTVEELGKTFGRVAPLVQTAGGTMSEYAAVMATLTAGGIKTTEATTGFSSVLSNLIKVTPKAAKTAKSLGIDFSAAAIKSKGMIAVLEDIARVTKGDSELLGKLFDSKESINSVSVLLSNLDRLKKIHAEMTNAAGTTAEALAFVQKSFSFNWGKFTQQMSIMSETMGGALVPVLLDTAEALTPIVEFISALILQHPGIIKVTAAVTAFGVAWSFLGGKTALILTAVISTLTLLSKHFDIFADGGAHAFNYISDHFRRFKLLFLNSKIGTILKDAFSSLTNISFPDFDLSGIISGDVGLEDAFTPEGYFDLQDFVSVKLGNFTAFVKYYWKKLKNKIGNLSLGGVSFNDVYDGAVKWFSKTVSYLEGLTWSSVFSSIKSAITSVQQWFYELWDYLIGHSIIPDIVEESEDLFEGWEIAKYAGKAVDAVKGIFSKLFGFFVGEKGLIDPDLFVPEGYFDFGDFVKVKYEEFKAAVKGVWRKFKIQGAEANLNIKTDGPVEDISMLESAFGFLHIKIAGDITQLKILNSLLEDSTSTRSKMKQLEDLITKQRMWNAAISDDYGKAISTDKATFDRAMENASKGRRAARSILIQEYRTLGPVLGKSISKGIGNEIDKLVRDLDGKLKTRGYFSRFFFGDDLLLTWKEKFFALIRQIDKAIRGLGRVIDSLAGKLDNFLAAKREAKPIKLKYVIELDDAKLRLAAAERVRNFTEQRVDSTFKAAADAKVRGDVDAIQKALVKYQTAVNAEKDAIIAANKLQKELNIAYNKSYVEQGLLKDKIGKTEKVLRGWQQQYSKINTSLLRQEEILKGIAKDTPEYKTLQKEITKARGSLNPLRESITKARTFIENYSKAIGEASPEKLGTTGADLEAAKGAKTGSTLDKLSVKNTLFLETFKGNAKSIQTYTKGIGGIYKAMAALISGIFAASGAMLRGTGGLLNKIPGAEAIKKFGKSGVKGLANSSVVKGLKFILKKILIPIVVIYDLYKGFTDLDRISEITGIDTSKVKSAVENLEAAELALESLEPASKEYASKLKDIASLTDLVSEAEEEAGLSTGTKVTSALSNAIGNFISGFAHLGAIITDYFGLDKATNTLKNVDFAKDIDKLFNTLSNIGKTIRNLFGSDADAIIEFDPKTGKAIKKVGMFDTMLDSALSLFINSIKGVVTLLENFTGALEALSRGDFGGVLKFFKRIFNTMWDYVKSAFSSETFGELQESRQAGYNIEDTQDDITLKEEKLDKLIELQKNANSGKAKAFYQPQIDKTNRQLELLNAKLVTLTTAAKTAQDIKTKETIASYDLIIDSTAQDEFKAGILTDLQDASAKFKASGEKLSGLLNEDGTLKSTMFGKVSQETVDNLRKVHETNKLEYAKQQEIYTAISSGTVISQEANKYLGWIDSKLQSLLDKNDALTNRASNNKAQAFATGGTVAGSGTGTSDSIPAMLSNGEYVINAKATKKNKALLEMINSGRVRGFQEGGPVTGDFYDYTGSKKATIVIDGKEVLADVIDLSNIADMVDTLDKGSDEWKKLIVLLDHANRVTKGLSLAKASEQASVADLNRAIVESSLATQGLGHQTDATASSVRSLGDASEDVATTLKNEWKGFGRKLTDPIKRAMAEGGDIGQAFSEGVRNLMQSVNSKLADRAFKPLENMIDEGLNLLFGTEEEGKGTQGSPMITKDWQAITGSSTETGGLIGKWTRGLLGEGTSGTVADPVIVKDAGAMLGGFGEGEQPQAQMIVNQMEGFGNEVTGAISNQTNATEGFFGNLGSLFSDGLSGIGDWIGSLGNSLGGLFGGGSGGFDIGSLIGGFFGFADGGIVPEPNGAAASPTDTVPALLTPGEMVLNGGQQEGIASSISSATSGISGIGSSVGSEGGDTNAIVAAVHSVSATVSNLDGSINSGLSSVVDATMAGAEGVKTGQVAMQAASQVAQLQASTKETAETTVQTTALTGIMAGNTAAVISAVTATGLASFASTGGIVTKKGISPLYFQRGGFVPKGTDTVPAMLTPGEMVLNKGQQAALGASGPVINQTLNITEAMDPKQFQAELVKNNKVVVGLVQQSYNKRGQNGPQGYGK